MASVVKTIVKNIFSFLVCGFIFCIGASIMAAVIADATKNGANLLICWGAYFVCCLGGVIWVFSRLFQTGK